MNVYVSDDLKATMDALGDQAPNWSSVAQEAFRLAVMRISAEKRASAGGPADGRSRDVHFGHLSLEAGHDAQPLGVYRVRFEPAIQVTSGSTMPEATLEAKSLQVAHANTKHRRIKKGQPRKTR